jgi:hypothetical protein
MKLKYFFIVVCIFLISFICAGCVQPNSDSIQPTSNYPQSKSVTITPSSTAAVKTQVTDIQPNKVWGDMNIGLNLGGIKRANSFPSSGNPRQPKPGNDFAIITISVSDIKNVTVVDLGTAYSKDAFANLITDKGDTYPIVSHTIRNLYINPAEISEKHLIPSSIVEMIFEIPISEHPVNIIVPYEYYEGENNSKLLMKKIEISL